MEEILKILNTVGYETQGKVITIGEANIKFDAVLQSPLSESELVLIEAKQTQQSKNNSFSGLLKRVEVLSLLLSRIGSSRVINLILFNMDLNKNEIRKLERLCRVIQVSDGVQEDIIQSLNTLLPLELPEPVELDKSATSALENNLGDLANDKIIKKLINAAHLEEEDVEKVAINSLEDIFKEFYMYT